MQTELEIINAMLASTGERATTSPESLHPSVVATRKVLTRVNRAVQLHGWYFNTERSRPLHPDGSGEVLVPDGTLELECVSERGRYVARGKVLYDLKAFTTIIGKIVYVDRVVQVGYDSMPASAFNYIMAAAVFDYFTDADGEGTKMAALQQARDLAHAALKREHIKWVRSNQLSNPNSLFAMGHYITSPYTGILGRYER